LTPPQTVPAGRDYRFAFFTGVSSVFCWPFLRTAVGLPSLLRFVDCTFCLKKRKKEIQLFIILTMVAAGKQEAWSGTILFR